MSIINIEGLQIFYDEVNKILNKKAETSHSHTYNELLNKNGYKYYGVRFVDNGTDFEATRLGLAKDATISEDSSTQDDLGNTITKKVSSFDNFYPWSKMRRVIVDNNLAVVDYFGSDTYDDTLSSNGYAPHTHAVMVEIPKFYSKTNIRTVEGKQEIEVLISEKAILGFEVDPMFLKGNPDGLITECNYVYVRAFEGVLCKKADGTFPFVDVKEDESDKPRENTDFAWGQQEVKDTNLYLLASVNAKNKQAPVTNTNMSNFRKMAEARSASKFFTQHTFNVQTGITKLFMVEFASMNIQQVLGDGVSTLSWRSINDAMTTGFTSQLGNASGNVAVQGVKRGSEKTYTIKVPSYRGMENLYGNVWKFTEGAKTGRAGQIKYGVYNPHLVNEYNKYDDNTFGKQKETIKVFDGNSNGYWKTFLDNSNLIPKIYQDSGNVFGSSATKYHGDQIWFNTGAGQMLLVGGSWFHGSSCGLFFSGWDNSFSSSYLDIGASLVASK